MLELYRASAGSGKTYTLAKKYIWYFLTIRPDNGEARLRTDEELAESARHILAVTFTNKATNEMQTRIVEALYDLALLRQKKKTLDDGTEATVNPDYLDDFCTELGVTPREVARVSKTGLHVLLENYSDFNVSTIDSFFQTVLRTFAYESELSDTYQVELDSDFLSRFGVDATLEEIDNNSKDSTTPFWIRMLIDRTQKGKWNIFTRTYGNKNSNTENPYRDFVDSVGKMETEDFKEIRSTVEEYFENHGDEMPRLYTALRDHYEPPVKKAFRELRERALNALGKLPDELLKASPNAIIGKPAAWLRKLAGLSSLRFSWDSNPALMTLQDFNTGEFEKAKWKEWVRKNPGWDEKVRELIDKTSECFRNWTALAGDAGFRHWMLYARQLPYFALFNIVARKRMEYLEENNAVELGETSMIIHSVIGDSDTPFVYERLGTRLEHFLIDEFQDTSKMQWTNLSPLLSQSLGNGHGNLIIGDAKQSIYRFRNADPSLITDKVPSDFSQYVTLRGNVPAENTNYRSELRVVQFNNSFFRALIRGLDSLSAGEPGRRMFGPLYSNVVQRPDKTAERGYVEVHFISEPQKGNKKTEVDIPQEGPAKRDIPGLIQRLLDRGYQQREIAVLVSRHQEGETVIHDINAHNARLKAGEENIRFVSEQSLKVNSSRAVNVITGVLLNLARGSNPTLNEGDDRRRMGVGVWREHAANFKYYSLNNRDRSTADNLNDYIDGGAEFNALSEMLEKMQSLAIPALTEAIGAKFLSEAQRAEEAVYLAAFQDLVLEYCENHPTDIGSFLRWWDRKKETASIASPENTDAVQIITIHKAKGLQYDCVIIPFANWNFSDSSIKKKEWRWVEPLSIGPEADTLILPERVPVETTEALKGTIHESLLYDYYDSVRMDRLNAAYVAFTRAKKEMYIFTEIPRNFKDYSIGKFLRDFLESEEPIDTDTPDSGAPLPHAVEKISLLPRGQVTVHPVVTGRGGEELQTVTVGRPDTEIGKNRKAPPRLIPLEKYESVEAPAFLKYRTDTVSSLADASEREEAEASDLDIRSEGTIKHAVLEKVIVPADLPAAVRHKVLTGELPESLAASVERDLAEALARPEVAHWFDGTARVLNERPVLRRGYMSRRPDRLLVYPDGTATVIDYKFGKEPTDNKHRNQIERYVRLLRETGRFLKVSGFLWYVNEHKIVPVD